MTLVLGLAHAAYKNSIFYDKKRRKEREKEQEPENGEDYKYVQVVSYEMVKRTPYDIMTTNFRKTSLTKAMELAIHLMGKLSEVRANNLIFEPIHIGFVGKAGQCKTQLALHVMKIFEACGLIGITRNATDGFFDDLVKQVKAMLVKKVDDMYVYHPDTEDRENVDLDVLFLDEVNARKTDDPGMQTIMDGVTPMRWKPLMANPSYKGRTYKPALWLSTANHEITKHEYCMPAVLRRTHHRYVVHGGRMYAQTCYKIVDANGAYQGGFDTCHGRFGRWDENTTTTSTTETVDPDGKITLAKSSSSSAANATRLRDTLGLPSLKCAHCKEISFSDFVELTLTQVIERIDTALHTHHVTNMALGADSSFSDSGLGEEKQE